MYWLILCCGCGIGCGCSVGRACELVKGISLSSKSKIVSKTGKIGVGCCLSRFNGVNGCLVFICRFKFPFEPLAMLMDVLQ